MDNFNLYNYINSHLVDFNTISGNLKNTLELVSNELLDFDKFQSQYYTIDRFEGDYAVCEMGNSNKIINILKSDIVDNVKEGDCLIKRGNQFALNEEITEDRKQIIKDKFEKLKKHTL